MRKSTIRNIVSVMKRLRFARNGRLRAWGAEAAEHITPAPVALASGIGMIRCFGTCRGARLDDV